MASIGRFSFACNSSSSSLSDEESDKN